MSGAPFTHPQTRQTPVVSLSQQRQAVDILIRHGHEALRRARVPEAQANLILANAKAALRTIETVELHRDAIRADIRAVLLGFGEGGAT